jgi:hypothetical protein
MPSGRAGILDACVDELFAGDAFWGLVREVENRVAAADHLRAAVGGSAALDAQADLDLVAST